MNKSSGKETYFRINTIFLSQSFLNFYFSFFFCFGNLFIDFNFTTWSDVRSTRHAGTYWDMWIFPSNFLADTLQNPTITKWSRLCPLISYAPTMFRDLPAHLHLNHFETTRPLSLDLSSWLVSYTVVAVVQNWQKTNE